METLEVELYRAQQDFVATPARFSAFIGGVGSGKTYAGCVKALMHCATPGLGLVVAPTYPMLRDATLRTFLDLARRWRWLAEFHKVEMRAVVARSGTEVLFRSADEPDRLRGPNLSWCYVDEAALCDGAVWPVIIGRLREGGAGPGWITTTPRGRNWVWATFVEKPIDGVAVFRARTADNPYLPNGFLRDLEASYSGHFAKQELLGEFVTFEGLVYDDFDRQIHARADAPGVFSQVLAGVDWGYTNPAVVLVVGFDGDGRAWVVDEFYQRRRLVGEVAEEARRLASTWAIEAFLCDPSEPGNLAEFRQAGLRADGAAGAVLDGIQRVKARLARAGDGQPRLFVHPRCANLIAELESYCWKTRRGIGLVDEPEKANDHACDALRYVAAHVDGGGRPSLAGIEPPDVKDPWGKFR